MPAAIHFNRGKQIPNTRLCYLEERPRKGKRRQALFLCDCGRRFVSDLHWVRFLNTTSCGCFRSETTAQKNIKHSHAIRGQQSGAYRSWQAMHQRVKSDPYYIGKRTICDRWSGEDGFKNFYEDMGDRPEGLTLERTDNEKGYSPDGLPWKNWSNSRESPLWRKNWRRLWDVNVLRRNRSSRAAH